MMVRLFYTPIRKYEETQPGKRMKRRDFMKVTGTQGAMLFLLTQSSIEAIAQNKYAELEKSFLNPPRSVGPWVVWRYN